MKYMAMLLMAVSQTACISTPEVKNREVSAPQSYRFDGDPAATSISGVLEKYGNDWAYHGAFLTVQIGGQRVIARKPLDKYNFSGEVGGDLYRDRKVSATCTGFALTDRWTDVSCTVFVGTERTVTLVF